ncbi:MAG: hypothetical protein IBX49_08545 [Gammaproteobacteria bacterium]|nr:hypothetical protein [Gammaproteobacteria bacterium]
MSSELSFRFRELGKFIAAILASEQGRRIVITHLINALILAAMLLGLILLGLYGLFEGLIPRRRTLAYSLGGLFLFFTLLPLTMPFFSFKELFNRIYRRLTRRRLFIDLSRHVFYRPTWNGELSLHLAKANSLLGEKYRLAAQQTGGRLKNTSRELGISLARSIRDAVRHSRRLVERGALRPEQKISGATYGYLFGAAKSKLRLRRHQPVWWSRLLSGVFYRYGAMHAVFMYFIIHDSLPPAFDPVYFVASVGDVIGTRGI